MIPTIGRVVHYRLSAENIGIQRMMANERDANLARTGDVYPAEITPEQFVETTGLGHWRVPARVTE